MFLYLGDYIDSKDIKIDTEEISKYKWISLEELTNNPNYGKVASKIKEIIQYNINNYKKGTR